MSDYPFPWKFERKNYPEFYLLSDVREWRVQADILELLRTYDVDAIAIDAGGRRHRGRMQAAAKSAGVTLPNVATGGEIPAGFADLEATLAPTGRSLYVEVKAPEWIDTKRKVRRAGGKPTQAQLDFLSAKHHRGARVMVAWSATDVHKFLHAELVENHDALRR